MPTSVIEHIRRAVLRDRAGQGDGELLGRFIERHDEAALAALINRHGPMVWGVCRRLLGHHDAEDAFQATFVVLVRKASAIARRETVGSWLYGVAHQTALQARRTSARRRAREVQVMEMPDVEAAPQDRWPDVQPLLDQELSRLPDHYRAVVVLSDLEGKTRKEVAALLGCPEGTVASRLVRARSLLARRLTQRGVALSAGALAAALTQNVASAVMPSSVAVSTIRTANLFAAGQAAIPVKVAALAEGVLKTMLLTKLKSVMAVLLVAALVGVIGYGIARGQQKGDPAAPQKQASEKARKVGGAVVKAKAEKKDSIAWGKEVDGLQLGLALVPAGTRTFHQEETVKLAVKLRNVGKAKVTVTYHVLWDHAPQITTDTGGRVSVYMPPPRWTFYGYAPPPLPIKRALKPGETITLYNPQVAVKSQARARLLGEMRVATPTICVEPGQYSIAYAGTIQSHPKLTTGTVDFEVKGQIAWGKEAGGLQAGLYVSNTSDVRIGGKARMVVKLRNVSKETIQVSAWPLWTCYPGVADARGDRVRTTTAPPPSFEIIPQPLTLEPGETVDAGRSDLFVAEPGQKVTIPDGVVDMCAIHVKPGMYKAHCVGFLKDNHALATGSVNFEVKPARVQSVTAWGKEQSGLQAGLSIARKRAYSHGETVKVVLKLRNVGKESVEFKHIWAFFVENPPTVTDADGKRVELPKFAAEGLHGPRSPVVAPGKEVDLYDWEFALRPAKWLGNDGVPSLYGTGKFSLQCDRVVGPTSANPNHPNPTMDRLATGKLDLEVTSAQKK
jgi:RNA polymerase sigma factor (sigma-70 family)